MEIEHPINPFRIDVDPMERLLLVNFERDPDTTYVGFEPQVFDDPVNGRGHLVIGWRQDGHVDVFCQAGLRLAPAKYDIAGQGLANKVERELAGARYEIDEFGVQAHYEFEDVHNRPVVIHINEQNPRARKPFGNGPPLIHGRRVFRKTQPASTSCARHGNESNKEIKPAGPALAEPFWPSLASVPSASSGGSASNWSLRVGIAHLPALAAIVTLTPLIVVRTILLNALGGLLFGWLYWRRSLEVAMVAHASVHVGIFVINAGFLILNSGAG